MVDQKIALIFGGMGAERDVSISTGKAFQGALDELGLNYVAIDAQQDLPERLYREKPTVALLALHGKYAEDGVVQGICEYLKIPYSGSGVLASALCMNKAFSKQILLQNNIPVAAHQEIKKTSTDLAIKQLKIKLPLVIKPSREGSSVGVHICRAETELASAFEDAFKYDSVVLVEEFIDGKEFAVSMIDGKAMTPIEIEPISGVYNYESKYTPGKTNYHLPPRISEAKISEMKAVSEKVWGIFDIRSYARVDFLSDKQGNLYCLEINTLPGCTETSLVPKAAKYDGIDFKQLVHILLETASRDYEGVE